MRKFFTTPRALWIVWAILGVSIAAARSSKSPPPAPAPSAQNDDISTATPSVSPRPATAPKRLSQTLEVESVAFATDISSKTPIGASDTFDASVGQIYFWTRVRVPNPPAQIKHLWYHDDKLVAEYALEINYKHTRLWTRKKVQPGLWRVEVTDGEGDTLTVATCIVRPSAAP